MSWPTAHRHYAAHSEKLLTVPESPTVLSIDKTRRAAVRAKTTPAGGRGWRSSRRTSPTLPAWQAARPGCPPDRQDHRRLAGRLAFIDTGIISAATDGTNRMIKDAAWITFGCRNFQTRRRRLRLHCKRMITSQPSPW